MTRSSQSRAEPTRRSEHRQWNRRAQGMAQTLPHRL